MAETIEDLILEQDKRGVAELRPHVPADFCAQAAQFIVDNPGDVAIVTGFYILSAGKPESDGPPGAIAIGRALQAMGRRVSYVTDECSADLMRGLLGEEAEVVEFPIADVETSRRASADILARLNLGLLISIERCGRTGDDVYLNMRSVDITEFTARVDYLFEAGVPSVGIGDGGNEIGMGNLAQFIPGVATLPNDPAITKVDHLIIASVSNWGGYGLVAALSRLAGRNLLPSLEEDTRLIKLSVDLGAVDGTTGEQKYYVDGFTTEENSQLLQKLHIIVDQGS
ncbi:MAG: DUF4392 domain-containing protein [Chloroflexi bacterium]|nr:DUF4392 domain-containing protein [Chloroflexota bacterium]